ncbi:hypothetical protein [Halopiger goleimassiliensis]|uniref:hypothetical protein n=1 Tax=Halopiger goleimassiliensis TaxID=1293048 RepID=UPI0006777CCA|nr:hypothetical protein [Halopiger goleimassiliensis]
MAEDNVDRAREQEAEREAEIEEELERVGRDRDEVSDGNSDLGTQNAPREEVEDLEDLDEAEGVDDVAVEEEEEAADESTED